MEKNKKKIIISLVSIGIIGLFFLSYKISNKYLGTDDSKERTVSNSIKNTLKDDMKIVLKVQKGENTDPKIEEEFTVKDLKKDLDVASDIQKDALIKYYAYSNYQLESEEEEKMVFIKKEKSNITANKYYVGEKDGYFAIYKASDKGELIIEDEKTDVFSERRKIDTIKEETQKSIKEFKHEFDSKEEAEEFISSLAS